MVGSVVIWLYFVIQQAKSEEEEEEEPKEAKRTKIRVHDKERGWSPRRWL